MPVIDLEKAPIILSCIYSFMTLLNWCQHDVAQTAQNFVCQGWGVSMDAIAAEPLNVSFSHDIAVDHSRNILDLLSTSGDS